MVIGPGFNDDCDVLPIVGTPNFFQCRLQRLLIATDPDPVKKVRFTQQAQGLRRWVPGRVILIKEAGYFLGILSR